MKYAFAAVALAAIARAQTLADIPACALAPLQASVEKNTDCALTDVACICENFSAIQGDATSAVIAACGADVAVNDVLPAAQALCANPPAAGGETTTQQSSAAPVAPTTAGGESSSSQAPAEPAPTAGYPTPAPEEPSTTPEPTYVAPPTTAEPEPTPIPTAGAATLGSVGALAMVVLGAIAL